MQTWMGKVLIAIGLLFLLAGLAVLAGPRLPWLGRLPGDIRLHGERTTIYMPLATSILLSIILTILLNFFLRR